MDIEDLHYRLIKLEEEVQLLKEKKWFKNQINEHKRILSSEYSNHLNNLKKEFAKYNPRKQVNIKKALLKSLPKIKMKLSSYFIFLSQFNLDYSMAEWEITLRKLGYINTNDEFDPKLVDQELLTNLLEVM